jgi:hypothetical protein
MKLLMENWQQFLDEDANAAEVDPKMFPSKLSAVDATRAKTLSNTGVQDGEIEDDTIPVGNWKGAAKDLKPSQNTMNLGKAAWFALGMLNDTMFGSGGPGGNLGAFVSSDNYMMDGHHRWVATAMSKPSAGMSGYLVGFPGKQLVAILNTITKGLLGVGEGKPGEGNFAQFHNRDAVVQVLTNLAQDKQDNGKGGTFTGVAGAMEPGMALKVIETKTGKKGQEAVEAMANFMLANVKTVPGVSDSAVLLPQGRADMPVIDDSDGPVQPASKIAIKALKGGEVNVNPPYEKGQQQQVAAESRKRIRIKSKK